jgi:transcriptional regulator with XRE-family HTH domain
VANNRDNEAIQLVATNANRIRQAKNISQEELANALNTSLGQMSRLLLGKTNPTISTLFGLAKALGVEPEDLIKRN